jgi:tyrosyl-tRNA synthetase
MINVNYLLEKEVISRRLETGISYAEFSYTLLQGYDFLHLFEKENIICQSGGSDQ